MKETNCDELYYNFYDLYKIFQIKNLSMLYDFIKSSKHINIDHIFEMYIPNIKNIDCLSTFYHKKKTYIFIFLVEHK